jgi:hypothetical protein
MTRNASFSTSTWVRRLCPAATGTSTFLVREQIVPFLLLLILNSSLLLLLIINRSLLLLLIINTVVPSCFFNY